MYIEDELWNWIESRCEKAHFGVTQESVEQIIEDCGVWYSFEGIKYETEDFDMTLEECYKDHWYIVEDDKVRFTNPDSFADDLDEYLGIAYEY